MQTSVLKCGQDVYIVSSVEAGVSDKQKTKQMGQGNEAIIL